MFRIFFSELDVGVVLEFNSETSPRQNKCFGVVFSELDVRGSCL